MLEIEIDHCRTVAVDLYQNQFVSKWQMLFERTTSACAINQVESFACKITELESQQRLLRAIDHINEFLKKPFIEITEPCNWDDQNWYNYLHSKFEQLSGSYGRPTRLFEIAPHTVRDAIRALNFYVHRLETRPYQKLKPWYISFDKNCYQRLPLESDDYELFEFVVQPGQAVIHYAELGKNLVDLYQDGLPTTYSGLRNLHFYSAEISISLSDKPFDLFPRGFVQWAQSKGIDVANKKLGIGTIPIGTVKDLDTTRQTVYTGNSITKLRII